MPSAYFSLQLTFAAHYATAAVVPFDVAVARCTNLRRRLHLWGPSGAEQWAIFLSDLGKVSPDQVALLSTTLKFHKARPPLAPAPTFGCFSYDSPNAAGVLRIHFMPPNDLDASPLAAAAVDARRHELRAMFQHIRSAHPEARSVMGVSWLYNLRAYTRLFPQAFIESIQPVRDALHQSCAARQNNLNAPSCWLPPAGAGVKSAMACGIGWKWVPKAPVWQFCARHAVAGRTWAINVCLTIHRLLNANSTFNCAVFFASPR